MQAKRKSSFEGIVVKHRAVCATGTGGTCNCQPTYQASVWSARDKRRIRKHFPTLAAARAWRADAQTALRRRTMRAPTATTLSQAAEEWLEGARSGLIRNRSGDMYKPSVIRGYEQALRQHLLPDLGPHRLSEISRVDVQHVADRLLASGANPSTIRNALMPLRVIFRRAVSRGELAINPATGVELPAVRGRRDSIVSPEQAAKLLEALPTHDRALWGTALYAGVRRGELMAMRWEDVDLATGVVRVEASYDPAARKFVEPKSRSGRRVVPMAAALRDLLVEHRMSVDDPTGLIFGSTPDRPFNHSTIRQRADRAWKKAELEPIGLHEARHTFASMMIAAGVNPKALSVYMGHSSITITLDRYGHLMPGNEEEAAGLLDAYLARAAADQAAAPDGALGAAMR